MNKIEYGQVYAGYMLNSIINKIPPDIMLKRTKKMGIVTKIDSNVRKGHLNINDYLNYEQYNDVVLRFYKILETALPHCKDSAFYKNIEKLSIKEVVLSRRDRLFVGNRDGIYDGFKNRVTIYDRPYGRSKEEKEDTATHELLHMASTYIKGPIILMGFKQSFSDSHSIGNGINEGYTEKLNRKYFSHNKKITSYREEQFIAEGIENIIGVEKMEQLYFAADLQGLIEELGKYCSTKQAYKLIQKIDLCSNSEYDDEKFKLSGQIREEIAYIYKNKQKQLLESGQISENEYKDNIIKNGFFYTNGYELEKTEFGYKYRRFGYEEENDLTESSFQTLKQKYFDNKEICFKAPEYIPLEQAATRKSFIDELNDIIESKKISSTSKK